MKKHIAEYLAEHANAWTAATQRTTANRLYSLEAVLTGKPEQLWKFLMKKGDAPSTRVITFAQAVHFWRWAAAKGYAKDGEVYASFRRRNRLLFKNCFPKRSVGVTYEEAKARIEAIEDKAVKRRALEILSSGIRWSESCQTGEVILGKGSRYRRVYRASVDGPDFTLSYATFLRKLKSATGLKPHDLRALAATNLVNCGLKEADLMAVMGWQSIATASRYVQPKKEEELAAITQKAFEGAR